MKNITKFTALILIIAIMFSHIVLAEDNKLVFSDLEKTYWAYDSIEKLVDAGIIEGYPDGTFNPDGFITRAELVKIVNEVFSFTQKQDTTILTDINSDDWFFEYVLIAQEAGYIDGYEDGTFKPNNDITRQELCKILDAINNFVELPFDNKPSDEVSLWAEEYVSKVISNRIILLDSENKFRATEKATRAEACDALAKFLIESEEEVISTPGSTNQNDEITNEELTETMDTVIKRLKLGAVPKLTNEGQKEILNSIIENMEEYQNDSSHNYEAAAEETYKIYKELSEEEQDVLIETILDVNTTPDLIKLKDFFFPDINISL